MNQLFTLLLGIVVLLSTTGLPRIEHLCGGIVQSAGIGFAIAQGCDHENSIRSVCTARAIEDEKLVSPSCCKKPKTSPGKEEKDCCTDEVDWEPSQVDLAIGDQVTLGELISLDYAFDLCGTILIAKTRELNPYVRPPPFQHIPLTQSRRRALLQVYRC